MIEIAFSSSFKRAFKKKVAGNKNLETQFWERVELFKSNPFDPKLKTHRLSGKLKDLWSFRAVFTSVYGKGEAAFFGVR